jgi:Xaa-Pro aminopeptidase
MQTEYAKRRARIFAKLASGSLAILPASEEQRRNGDVSYPFRQDSNFYYLTGFSEPGAILVLLKTQHENRVILFCKPFCAEQALWKGPSAGLEGAIAQFGADEAYDLASVDTRMPALLAAHPIVFYSFGASMAWDRRIIQWSYPKDHKPKRDLKTFCDFLSLIAEERLIKSDAEIALLRQAITVSAEAHSVLMQQCVDAMPEYALEALFAYACAKQGCRSLAYPSIVGGGANACTLHYVQNDQPLKNGDLVLVDAGAEYQGYAADITRTFPVNGRFSADQKALYSIVLEAQCAAIALVKPGTRWDRLQAMIVKTLTEGLVALGILKGAVDQLIDTKAYQAFYQHGSGHWLGLDVHDVGAYKQAENSRLLAPGMVLTVEPGLYIPADCQTVDPRWRGIGIRIEDDVLVTDTGHEVLSVAVPKTIEAIEALMGTTRHSSANA